VRASLSDVKLADAKTRSDIVGTVHAIESGGQWAKGVVFGYSVAISESILVVALLVAMFVASPLMSLVLLVVLGGAAGLLNIFLTRGIRRLSMVQMASSKEMKSNLSAAVSSKLQIRLRGRVEEWEAGIASGVRKTSSASTTVYLLRSMPRYVMEIAILFSVAAVGAISLLAGDLGDNVPGAAVILAGAFRITGALLPLQGALNLVSNSNQLGSDFFAFVHSRSESRGENLQLREKLSTAISEFASSDTRILVVTGESGIGKSTSLAALLLDSPETHGLPTPLGFGGQRANLLPGGATRNISLQFEPKEPGVLDANLERLVDLLAMKEPLARLERLNESDLEVFSGGELTRLEILRAHAGNPSLVVLDEPSSGLDPKLVEGLASYLNASQSRYIVISHDLSFASKLENSTTFDLRTD
jgi:ABC-type lipoprotein export system ATPase subunit